MLLDNQNRHFETSPALLTLYALLGANGHLESWPNYGISKSVVVLDTVDFDVLYASNLISLLRHSMHTKDWRFLPA